MILNALTSQSNNLITDSTLRSEVQLTTATSTRVVEPQVIAIAIEDNKDAFRDNNYNNNSKKNNNQTNDIDDEENQGIQNNNEQMQQQQQVQSQQRQQQQQQQ